MTMTKRYSANPQSSYSPISLSNRINFTAKNKLNNLDSNTCFYICKNLTGRTFSKNIFIYFSFYSTLNDYLHNYHNGRVLLSFLTLF